MNSYIKALKKIIDTLESKDNTEDAQKPTKPSYSKAVQTKTTINIDMDGNQETTEDQNDKVQPIDKVKVKNTYCNLPPCPNLSTSTQQEADLNLLIHNTVTNKQIEDYELKLREQKNMSKKEKDKATEELLTKSSCNIGIAPLTKNKTYTVSESMTKRGILKRSEDDNTRL